MPASDSSRQPPPSLAVGLALVILSCSLLAVDADGTTQVVVRVLQVGLAILGAVVLGRVARQTLSR